MISSSSKLLNNTIENDKLLWDSYAEQLSNHITSSNTHSAEELDDSCIKCNPLEENKISDQEFGAFVEWLQKRKLIHFYTSKTFEYFKNAVEEKDQDERDKIIVKLIQSVRYKKERDLSEIFELTVNKWAKTDGFQPLKMRNLTSTSDKEKIKRRGKGKRVEHDDEESNKEIDYDDALHINESSSKGYKAESTYEGSETESEEESEQ